eukprot:1193195-Prorocentrum_minimum.AAC.1
MCVSPIPSSLTLRGLLTGTPRRGIASQELRSLRSDGPEIRPGVGARARQKRQGNPNPDSDTVPPFLCNAKCKTS